MAELVGKLGIDWRLLLASVVNFLLLFVILKRYAFGPLLRMLEKRERMVVDTVKRSEAVTAEQRALAARKAEALKAARIEAAKFIERSAEQAEALRAQVLADAQAEAQRLVAATKVELAAERAALTTAVRADVGSLVAAAAEKVIRQKLTAPADRRLIDRVVARVAKEMP